MRARSTAVSHLALRAHLRHYHKQSVLGQGLLNAQQLRLQRRLLLHGRSLLRCDCGGEQERSMVQAAWRHETAQACRSTAAGYVTAFALDCSLTLP
jgi:hypothetical protein